MGKWLSTEIGKAKGELYCGMVEELWILTKVGVIRVYII